MTPAGSNLGEYYQKQ